MFSTIGKFTRSKLENNRTFRAHNFSASARNTRESTPFDFPRTMLERDKFRSSYPLSHREPRKGFFAMSPLLYRMIYYHCNGTRQKLKMLPVRFYLATTGIVYPQSVFTKRLEEIKMKTVYSLVFHRMMARCRAMGMKMRFIARYATVLSPTICLEDPSCAMTMKVGQEGSTIQRNPIKNQRP